MMRGAECLASMRSVELAASALTLACTEYVGPVAMALSLPTLATLGEPVPDGMERQVAATEASEQGETKQ